MKYVLFPQLLIAAALALPTVAQAWMCSKPEPEDALYDAPAIIYGHVLEPDPKECQYEKDEIYIEGYGAHRKARFHVDVAIKGNVPDEVTLGYGSWGCGRGVKKGEILTLFAWKSSRELYFKRHRCDKNWPAYDPNNRQPDAGAAVLNAYLAKRREMDENLARPQPDIALLQAQAWYFAERNGQDEAMRAIDFLLARNPRDAAAIAARGMLRYCRRDFAVALADFQAALAIDSKQANARHGRAMTRIQLGQPLDAGDNNFAGLRFGGDRDEGGSKALTLVGQSLAGANFSKARLGKADFSGADLRGADFSDAVMQECNFTGAKLQGARFERSQCHEANFGGASIHGASFRQAAFDQAQFAGAHLAVEPSKRVALARGAKRMPSQPVAPDFTDAYFDEVSFAKANLPGAVFRDVRFRHGGDFSGADLSAANFSHAFIGGGEFKDAKLAGALFAGATLKSVTLAGLDLRGLVFDGAKASELDVSKAQLSKSSFRGAILENATFDHAQLDHATFNGATLKHVKFNGALLADVDFDGVALSEESEFKHAQMQGAYFRGAKLSDAVFDDAVLDRARFDNATLKQMSLLRVTAPGALLIGTVLEQSKLEASNWQGSTWRRVSLAGVSMRDADLRGSTLRALAFARRLADGTDANRPIDLRGVDLTGLIGVQADDGVVPITDCRTRFGSNAFNNVENPYEQEKLLTFPLWSNCPGKADEADRRAADTALHRGALSTWRVLNATGADLAGRTLTNLRLIYPVLDQANIAGATLDKVDIEACSCANTDFSRAEMSSVNLNAGYFHGASFKDAKLSKATIRNIDFSKSVLDGLTLAESCFDKKTVWPTGFDPVAAGGSLCQKEAS